MGSARGPPLVSKTCIIRASGAPIGAVMQSRNAGTGAWPNSSAGLAHGVLFILQPGTLGWDNVSANTGLPTAPWCLPQPLILSKGPDFGVQSGQFGFTISWATN